MSFLAVGRTRLGVYHAHRLHLSLDDIASQDYLPEVMKARNALLISGFQDEDGGISIAALGGAVLEKLQAISPPDYHKLIDQLSQKSDKHPGNVVTTELHVPQNMRVAFPIDRLYTVLFTAGQPVDTDELSNGLISSFRAANEQDIENMVVPCLGRNWEHSKDDNALSYADFFSKLFGSISPDFPRPDIYLSLYRQSPSFELEEAVGDLNSSWDEAIRVPRATRVALLYREKYRTTLLAWFLCLLVSSFFAVPKLKSFLIISSSFLAVALGSDAVVSFLAQSRPSLEMMLHYSVLAVLATGFPAIVRWDPKDLFK